MPNAPRFSDWFTYFPDDYRWSAALALVLGSAPYGGAELGEVDAVGRRLRGCVGDDEAWFEAWREMAGRLGELSERSQKAGHRLTSAGEALRACSYYQIGERFRLPKDRSALEAYESSLRCFERFAACVDWPRLERVEVPYEGGSLPGYLVTDPARGVAPSPAVVFFDGLDVTKELQYLRGATELVRRGMSCLLLDGPGNGESIRMRNLPLRADYEKAGSAALDYLSARPEVDSERVGVMAISLGGYYATRCASMDDRFRACVAWGAIWDYHATWERRISQDFQTSLSVAGEHIAWVMGKSSVAEALVALEPFRLADVAPRMRCPFLLLHGTEDEQVPLADARALFEAVGSQDKTLELFDPSTGGATHCQTDRLSLATTTFADWLSERLVSRGPVPGAQQAGA
ncbi:MAG: alpha/beta hydrolase family protein [Acidimicrobiales bacterium]